MSSKLWEYNKREKKEKTQTDLILPFTSEFTDWLSGYYQPNSKKNVPHGKALLKPTERDHSKLAWKSDSLLRIYWLLSN